MIIRPFTKSYGGAPVLDFPGASLPEGEVCAVIGANGSGKSTLARIVAGAMASDQGRPVLEQAGPVGYLPQRPYPFQMTVEGNLLLNAPGGRADARRRAAELMEQLEIAHLVRKKAHHLSGGETARMALARLLMRRYQLLILDEPTAAMDVAATLLAEEILLNYHARTGCTVLLVTHSLTQARRLAGQVLFLREGRLVEQGEAGQVLFHPRHAETKAFLDFYAL